MSKVVNDVVQLIKDVYSNPIVSGLISLFLNMYGGLAVNNLPPSVLEIVNMPIVKFIIIVVIAVMTGLDINNGILASIGFILTMTMTKKLMNSNNVSNNISNNDVSNNNVSNNNVSNNNVSNNNGGGNSVCSANMTNNSNSSVPVGLVDDIAENASLY